MGLQGLGRTIQAEAGLQAQRVARAQAAQADLRVRHQLLRNLQRPVARDGQLEAVFTRVPAGRWGLGLCAFTS